MKATILRKAIFVFIFCFSCTTVFSLNIFDDNFFREDSASYLENNKNSNNLVNDYQLEFIHRSIKQYQNIGGLCEFHFLRNNFFNPGFDIYQDYHLNSKTFSHRLLSNYFSQLKYLLGTRKEQIISVNHQQKLWKGLSTGFIYRGIASPGFYKRQFNNIRNFKAYLNFYSANEKYDISFIYFANKSIAQENGGIVADSLLSVYKGQERSINVNLNGAEHRIRSRGYTLYQTYNFMNGNYNDSLKRDSLARPFIGFEQATEFSRQSFVYSDMQTNSDYYSNSFLSDSLTNDSISFQKTSFDLYFLASEIPLFKKKNRIKMRFKLGVELNYYKSNQYNVSDTSFSANSADVSVGFYDKEKSSFTTIFKKDLESNNGGSYISYSKFVYRFSNIFSKVGADYRNQVIPAEYISEYLYSNHFIWRNNFDNRKESYFRIFAGFFKTGK